MDTTGIAPGGVANEDARLVKPLLVAALLMAALLGLWRLDIPLQGSEGRWGCISMEMLNTGDYFTMTIGGTPYPDKPFGSYWLIALTAKVTGRLNEFVTRLPSVLCFILATYVVFLLGKRTVGALPGAVAACVFPTAFRFLFFSRVASADPHTVLGVGVAMLLILEASEDPRWWHIPALGFVMGATSLMKGLGGMAVPCFAGFLWTVCMRGFGWLRPLPTALGVVTFALTLGLPLAIPWLGHGDDGPARLLWRESVVRGFKPYDHVQPWYFYFWNQFEMFAPWSVLLPAALVLAWTRVREHVRAKGGFCLRIYDRSEDRRRIFPLFGYLAIFLFFTLSGSRRTYYLMPIAPFLSLLVAEALLETGPNWTARLRKWALAALAVVGIVGGVGGLAVGILRLTHPQSAPALLNFRGALLPEYWQAVPFWIFLVAGGIPLGILLLKRMDDRLRALAPAIALVLVMLAGAIPTLEALRDQARGLQKFCAQVRAIVPPDCPIEIQALQTPGKTIELSDPPTLLFYLGRPFVKPGGTPARFRIVNNERAQEIFREEPGLYAQRCIEPRDPDVEDDPKAEKRLRVLLERVK